jgi:hypothetical protein
MACTPSSWLSTLKAIRAHKNRNTHTPKVAQSFTVPVFLQSLDNTPDIEKV